MPPRRYYFGGFDRKAVAGDVIVSAARRYLARKRAPGLLRAQRNKREAQRRLRLSRLYPTKFAHALARKRYRASYLAARARMNARR